MNAIVAAESRAETKQVDDAQRRPRASGCLRRFGPGRGRPGPDRSAGGHQRPDDRRLCRRRCAPVHRLHRDGGATRRFRRLGRRMRDDRLVRPGCPGDGCAALAGPRPDAPRLVGHPGQCLVRCDLPDLGRRCRRQPDLHLRGRSDRTSPTPNACPGPRSSAASSSLPAPSISRAAPRCAGRSSRCSTAPIRPARKRWRARGRSWLSTGSCSAGMEGPYINASRMEPSFLPCDAVSEQSTTWGGLKATYR